MPLAKENPMHLGELAKLPIRFRKERYAVIKLLDTPSTDLGKIEVMFRINGAQMTKAKQAFGNTHHLSLRPANLTPFHSSKKQPLAATEEQYVSALKNAQGGAWSTAAFIAKAGITRQGLKERRDNYTIVYWTDAKGHCSYPKWQFDANLQVLSEVRAVLALLRTHDTLYVLNKFLTPAIGDQGDSVLDMIQSGRGAEAVAYVKRSQENR
jgi:hypothetical protein